MKRRISLMTVILLLGQMFLNTFSAVVSATALESTGNLFSEVVYLDEKGQPVNFETYSGPLTASIGWSVEGNNVTRDTIEEIQLNETVVYQAQAGELIVGEEETPVGSYQLTPEGKLSVQFNEVVESHQQAKGTLQVTGRYEATTPEKKVVDETSEPKDTEESEASEESEEDLEKIDQEIEKLVEVEDSQKNKESSIIPFAIVQDNLVSNFELILNPGPNEEQITNGDIKEVNLNDMNALRLIYGITKPDGLYITEGDTYTIDLPSIFGSIGASDQPITIGDTIVGTYNIINGQVVITFNSSVNNHDDVEMYVNITGAFTKQVFETEEEVVVNVPYQDGQGYTATIQVEKQEYDGQDLKTAGEPYVLNGEEKVPASRNPEFVDWTVRANDSMGSFDNAVIIDDLGPNLEIVEGSFVVERIIRNYQNEIIGREPIIVTPNITESGFELNLGAIEDAYDITYTTRLIRPLGGGNHTINNTARIILDGSENSVLDDINATWSGDIPLLDKSGNISSTNGDIIEWQLKYNYGQEELGSDVNLTDTLTHGEVILESIQVVEVETDIDGNVTRELATIEVTPILDDNGNVIIPGLDASGRAYHITYQSSVPVGLNNVKITNTIEDNYNNSDEASVTVNTIPTGSKVGEQLVDEEGNPYIEWTIIMNSQKVNISDIDIKDVFDGDYLTFDTRDVSLYEDGVKVSDFNIENYTHADGRIGFHLQADAVGPHEYRLVYRTYYTTAGMQESNLANDAELIFNNGSGDGIAIDVDFTQVGPKAGIIKSGKYILNEDTGLQEIEWTVSFNTSNILLNKPIISDTFTSGNYTFIENSLRMTENAQPFTDYVLLPSTNNGFTININKSTNAVYTITYRTTADDTNNLDQRNDVSLQWQGGNETANATVKKRDAGMNKTGQVVINPDGTKTINWTVNFNTNHNVFRDFALTDTYTPASVTVSNIQVKSEGKDVTEQFTITEPNEGSFTVTAKDGLAAVPYQLTYSTTLSPTEETQEIKNTADIVYTGGSDSKTATIAPPTLGVQKEAMSIEKGLESDFINWKITVNTDTTKHLVNLVGAELTDEIPLDQKLVKGSIRATQVGTDLEVDSTQITENDNHFIIKLPNGTYQYVVTFKTEILEYPSVNTKIDRYTNKTTLTNTGYASVTDDAYIDYFSDGTNNNNLKSGEINNDTENTDWNVLVNPLGLTINNATITDKLSDNQTYVENSIVLTDSEGNELESPYTVTLSADNRSFTITFDNEKGQINEPIKINYSTRLNSDLIGFFTMSNTVELRGGQDRKELSRTTKEQTTSQWSYGGGGSGRTVQFTLKKQHPTGESIANATFSFIRVDASGAKVPISGVITTDENGVFEIKNTRAGRYIVTEESVPEGYEKLEQPFHIIIGYTSPEEKAAGSGDYIVKVTDSNWNIISNDVVAAEGNTLIVNNEVEKGQVIATKQWGDIGQSSYPTTWFKLYQNLPGEEPQPVEDAEIKQINSTSSSTVVTWDNIDLYSPSAVKYEFSVKEVDAEGNDYTPKGYIKVEAGYLVINRPVENPTIQALKEITGRQLRDGEFKFVLKNEENQVVSTVQNDVQGNISFRNFLSLTDEQMAELRENNILELKYTIEEVSSNMPGGVTYDDTVYSVTIRFTYDAANKSYAVSYTYPDGNPVFRNVYKAEPTTASFTAAKKLSGLELENKQFDFELLHEGKVIQTKSNDQEGNILFDAIEFDSTGTYSYQIREVQGNVGGINYDNRVFNVNVEVTDNGEGQLIANPIYVDGPITFTNSYVPVPDSIVIEGTKQLENRNLTSGQFSFELRDSKNNIIDTAYNNADGQIVFDELTFTTVGEYRYTVNEVADNQTGYTYDDRVFGAVITVVDDKEGKLTATVNYEDGPIVFENAYTPKPDRVVLTANKVLEGMNQIESQFEFVLKDEDGLEVDRQRNNSDGSINFTEISYRAAGTYNYTIEEVNLGQDGITYDTSIKNIVVHVYDNQGVLNANVEYIGGPAVFTNTYKAQPDSVIIEAEKRLAGQQLRDGQFTFELVNDLTGEVVLEAHNNADGQIIFEEITYDKVGEFNYTIREVTGSQGGMIYDPTEYGVTAVVVDDGKGQLIAELTYSDEEVIFNNIYTPANGSAVIEANKVLQGKTLTENRFEFNLLDQEENILQTVSNNSQGQIIFDPISYEEVGEYTYFIEEVNDYQGGITYDTTRLNVLVTVSDNGEGKLESSVSYRSGQTFTNTYKAAPAEMTFKAKKNLIGQPIQAEQFNFELVDESGEVIQTASNDMVGQVTFDKVIYDQTGKYTYIIREKQATQGGMTYDKSSFIAVVDVTDSENGNLMASVNYVMGSPVFTNTYTYDPAKVIIKANKVLVGKELADEQFKFELVDSNNNVIQTVENNEDGTINFEEVSYDTVGEYTYTIREVAGSEKGYTYDNKEIAVTVKVTDNREGQYVADVSYEPEAVFTNTYTPLPTEFAFEASKNLSGRKQVAGEFNFEIVDEEGNRVATGQNDSEGHIAFSEVTYDKAGIHDYIIREIAGTDSNITYDPTLFKLTVDVIDEEGQLVVKPTYLNEVVFKNSYTPHPTEINLKASKTLTGRAQVANEFDFEVVNSEEEVVATGTNTGNREVSFSSIQFSEVGTYTYTIREKVGTNSTIAYTDAEFEVTVIVEDVDGQLVATADYANDVVFKNSYTPHPTKLVLKATKELNGRPLAADEFNFAVRDSNNNTVATGKNDADGVVTFTELTYLEAGTHTYTILEVLGNNDTITYSDRTFEVTVEVTDKEGQLVATPIYDGDVIFENSYKPHPGEITLEASKQLTGRSLLAGEFTFEVIDSDGKTIAVGVNDADRKVTFSSITYEEVGTYDYTIREVAGTDSTITYDTTTFGVSVEVKDVDGQLVANAAYATDVIFKNSYTPHPTSVELEARKNLVGRDLISEEFNFEILNADQEVVANGTNDAVGEVNFTEIKFTETGVYTYTIREVKGDNSTITYDDSTFEVTVEVVDSGGQLEAKVNYDGDIVFENTYKPHPGEITTEGKEMPSNEETKGEELPYTGRETSNISYVIGSLFLLSGLSVLFVTNRKKEEN